MTGLYHFAVLFPNRRELARAMARLFALKYRNYPTDHIMTKTTYLDDPEGNGIELYAESPEDGTWTMANGEYVTRRADGSLSDGREPLDVDALFSHLKEDDRLDVPIPPETRVGHIHLHVRDIEEAVDFYHGVIGFDVMGVAKAFRMAFVSAGGYHHHIGLNTWQGEGRTSAACRCSRSAPLYSGTSGSKSIGRSHGAGRESRNPCQPNGRGASPVRSVTKWRDTDGRQKISLHNKVNP